MTYLYPSDISTQGKRLNKQHYAKYWKKLDFSARLFEIWAQLNI